MNVLILGANGFIGSHLSEAILSQTYWHLYAMDLTQDKLSDCLKSFIELVHVVLPLVAVATPELYVQDPLSVFELDFEANLEIVRLCVEHKKRLVYPSTSEVYGMCPHTELEEEKSHLVTGPI